MPDLETSDNEEMLDSILDTLSRQNKAISHSKDIINDIESKIYWEIKQIRNCFKKELTIELEKSGNFLTNAARNASNATPDDKLLQHLAKAIKKLISTLHPSANTGTISTSSAVSPSSMSQKNCAGELLNLMLAKLESQYPDLTALSSADIIQFLTNNYETIVEYIDRECTLKIIGCLDSEIKKQKIKLMREFSPTVNEVNTRNRVTEFSDVNPVNIVNTTEIGNMFDHVLVHGKVDIPSNDVQLKTSTAMIPETIDLTDKSKLDSSKAAMVTDGTSTAADKMQLEKSRGTKPDSFSDKGGRVSGRSRKDSKLKSHDLSHSQNTLASANASVTKMINELFKDQLSSINEFDKLMGKSESNTLTEIMARVKQHYDIDPLIIGKSADELDNCRNSELIRELDNALEELEETIRGQIFDKVKRKSRKLSKGTLNASFFSLQ